MASEQQNLAVILHGLAPECDDAVAAVQRASRVLYQAEKNREAALKSVVAGAGGSAAGGVALLLCAVTAETIIVPILCASGGLLGIGAGAVSTSAAVDWLEAADGALEDARDALKQAKGAMCGCLMKHGTP